MSYNDYLQNTFSELKYSMNNNGTLSYVVQNIVDSIRNSEVVEKQNRQVFSKYWDKYRNGSSGSNMSQYALSMSNNFTPIDSSRINETSTQNIAMIAVSYYLSNLNKYDYHLINYSMRVGLDVPDVIMLLLLNDINSIDLFCRKKNIHSQSYYMIVTLKKLSALYKIDTSF